MMDIIMLLLGIGKKNYTKWKQLFIPNIIGEKDGIFVGKNGCNGDIFKNGSMEEHEHR
jgi:hypothetical protein